MDITLHFNNDQYRMIFQSELFTSDNYGNVFVFSNEQWIPSKQWIRQNIKDNETAARISTKLLDCLVNDREINNYAQLTYWELISDIMDAFTLSMENDEWLAVSKLKNVVKRTKDYQQKMYVTFKYQCNVED